MTALTLEDINQAALAASMCDDYSQHKKEKAEVAKMRAQYRRENPASVQKARPAMPAEIRKEPLGHTRCGSFEEAKSVLNAICGI